MVHNTDEEKTAEASCERRAQDREAHLQQMLVDTLESITDAFFALDDDLVVTYWNQAAERSLGRTVDEVIGKPLFEAFPEARGSIFETRYREAVRTRRPLMFETYFEAPPYQNWYEVRVYPRPNGISVYFLVTTDRKRAELALRESEERLRLISEAIPGVLYQFRLAPDGAVDFPYVSRGVYDIFGVNAEAVMADREVLMSLIHEADRETMETTIIDSAQKMSPYHLEHRIHRPDGEIRWIKAGSIPKPEEDGGVLWNGVIIDITDRKAAEERLRESEARNTTLIRNIHAAVVVHAPDTRITEINPQALELLGLTQDQALGRVSRDPDWAFLGADSEPIDPESYPVNQVLTTGAPLRDMIVGINRQNHGDVVWVLVNADPVVKADGDIHQVIVTFVDITERKRAEEERARLEEQFHQSQKLESIGRLAGGVAHDLNNLLSPILGYSEMLLADAAGMDPRRDSLTAIVTAGRRARDLVRQLLAFGRKQTLKVEPVDLNGLLKNFHKLLQRTIREDIVIHMDLARALPLIQGDAGQLEQVVMNLAVNSQDAMPDGGELTIETSAVVLDETYAAQHEGVTPGPYVMLAVSDTGCGMDAEIREHIFEPFFTTKEKHKGTGLGLATIYGIVKQHAGHIWIYSEPGSGATFKVYLPVAGGRMSAKTEALQPISATDTGGSETILVVEDNQQVRELTITILEREGYRVLSAHSGESALIELNRHDGPVHLLLTDVVMPDMNGRQLFDRISSTHPHTKVLYMSGYTDNVIAHRGVLDADIGFIQKPFTVTGLAAKVREVLT